MQRSASGELRWVVARYPTNAYAQDADMSLAEYEQFLFSTTYADRDDPIAAYEEIREDQEKLVKWMEGKDKVQLKGPNVDLELSVKGRKFINCCGHRNIPDGEIFTGPVEDSINGWVRFSFPTAHRGIEVEGVEFNFKDGEITKFQASKGEEALAAMFKGGRLQSMWVNWALARTVRSHSLQRTCSSMRKHGARSTSRSAPVIPRPDRKIKAQFTGICFVI